MLTGGLGFSQVGIAATQAQIDQAWNKGLSWLLTNQHGDGGWSTTVASGNGTQQGLGVNTTAAFLDALNAINFKSNYTYSAGIAWLSNAEAVSVDALARQTLAVKNSGADAGALGARLASWRNERLAWGAYRGYEAGLPDTALGAAALIDVQGAAYSNNDLFNALCQILPAQRPSPNNLWPYSVTAVASTPTSQSSSAIVPSVYAILALVKAGARFTGGTCGNGVAYTFSTNIAAGISGLVAKKNAADNGYGDNGASGVLETALVLRAFKSAAPSDVNAITAIDYLVAQQAVDGSWRGDALQTAEVLLSLASPTSAVTQRPSAAVITDTDKDGIPDSVETLLGLNANLADSRLLADGAGTVVTPPAQFAVASAPASAAALIGVPITASVIRVSSKPSQVVKISIVGRPPDTNLRVLRNWDKSADMEIHLVGSSLQLPALELAVGSMFLPGSMEIFMPTGVDREGAYRAYYGILRSGSEGKSLLVHFGANAGSYGGTATIARANKSERMIVDNQCVSTTVDHNWLCSANRTVKTLPDGGLSDVEPTLHVDANAPAGALPITADEVARLDAQRVNAVILGVAVSSSLKNAGFHDVSATNLARIFKGDVATNWSDVNKVLPPQPVIVCRMSDGSQPAVNTRILGTGCGINSAVPKPEFSSAGASGNFLKSPGLLVVENDTANDLATCLKTAELGGRFNLSGSVTNVPPNSFAIGMLNTDFQVNANSQFDFVALDSVAPSKFNVMTGLYPNFTETWMQWRRETVNGIGPPSGTTLLLLRALRTHLADVEVLRNLPGTVALTSAEGMQVSRAGDSCAVPR